MPGPPLHESGVSQNGATGDASDMDGQLVRAKRAGANESNGLQFFLFGKTASQDFSKLGFVDDFYAQFFCLIELATGFGAGEDVIGFLAHAAGDVAAERFDFFRCFLARH